MQAMHASHAMHAT